MASSKTSALSGDSTTGNARKASRAVTKARSSRNPCSTSWTTGKHVTTSSKSTTSSSRTRGRRRKTSTHTDVSTRTTRSRPRGPPRTAVVSHRAQIAFPEPRASEVEDLPRFGAAHEIVEGSLDRPGVRALAAQPKGFIQEVFIKHKICAFHTHSLQHARSSPRPGALRQPPWPRPVGQAMGPVTSLDQVDGETRAFGDGQRELAALAVAHDRDLDPLTGLERPHLGGILLLGPDRRALDRGEDVAAQQVLF